VGYGISQRLRKRIEEPFGWIKSVLVARDPPSRSVPRRLGRHADSRGVQPGGPAQIAGKRGMKRPRRSTVLGRWRIVEIEGWDADYIDMLGPGHIQVDRNGGPIESGAVQSGTVVTARPAPTSTFRGKTK
jgi:hypothetical protein